MRRNLFVLIFSCVAVTSCEAQINLDKNYTWPGSLQDVKMTSSNMLAKNYYVVLDGSGSMSGSGCSGGSSKISAAKKALIEFSKTVPSSANLGFLVFDNSGVTERLPLGINNRELFIKRVNEANAGSGTPLAESVGRAFEKLELQGKKQGGYGEYHLVIVTDGSASPGQDPTQEVNYLIENTPINIHTVGFCIDEGHSLNQPGRTSYSTAMNVKELVSGLKKVLAESEDFDVSDFSK